MCCVIVYSDQLLVGSSYTVIITIIILRVKEASINILQLLLVSKSEKGWEKLITYHSAVYYEEKSQQNLKPKISSSIDLVF